MTKKYTIIWPFGLLCVALAFALLMSACAPLVIGAGVGIGLTAHRDWCWRHYGNEYCRRMPMGVHR